MNINLKKIDITKLMYLVIGRDGDVLFINTIYNEYNHIDSLYRLLNTKKKKQKFGKILSTRPLTLQQIGESYAKLGFVFYSRLTPMISYFPKRGYLFLPTNITNEQLEPTLTIINKFPNLIAFYSSYYSNNELIDLVDSTDQNIPRKIALQLLTEYVYSNSKETLTIKSKKLQLKRTNNLT